MCALLIPISVLWFQSERILIFFGQDAEVARLSARYLHILFIGLPGYGFFETSKRFLQAQGIYHAGSTVLFIAAPINALLCYVLVWHPTLGFGFDGAPAAVAATFIFMAILLYGYIRLTPHALEGWAGFTTKALTGWGPMCKLAFPGVIMVASEMWALELTALESSYFGVLALASQSILLSSSILTYCVPFGLAVACSTRIGTYVGAAYLKSAKTASNAGLILGLSLALFNCIVLLATKSVWAYVFTNDPDVVLEVSQVMPIFALYQITDVCTGVAGGILRGQGRPHLGAVFNFLSFWGLGVPLGALLAFKFDLSVSGLWIGMAIALSLAMILSWTTIFRTNWNSVKETAFKRMAIA